MWDYQGLMCGGRQLVIKALFWLISLILADFGIILDNYLSRGKPLTVLPRVIYEPLDMQV